MASDTTPARRHRAPAKGLYFSKPLHPFIPVFMIAPQAVRAVQLPMMVAPPL